MRKKITAFLFSGCAGIFVLHTVEAGWRHEWWPTLGWLGLSIGWSLAAWAYFNELKEK